MPPKLTLKGGKQGEVVTRFPPEASGYIHVGHAKAALINSMLAKQYEGKMVLRFDDTNPDKEKVEFEEAILRDLESMNVKWDIGPTWTSDYFEVMLEYAEKLIKAGKAYCDFTPQEEMQKARFEGVPTPCRDHSMEKNLELWEEMKKASELGLKTCLRAKLSVDNPNKCLRDPVIYRCNTNPHPRTGRKYNVYPTYDFACPIVDSIEGVTHALRTSEYNDRNDQYKWMCKALEIRVPAVEDFSRLNMEYTVMSKRKLTEFVNIGKVWGWDDPRMPTLRGLLRKGLHIEALREFVKDQGMSKVANTMEWEKLWVLNKRILDPIAPRYNCVDQFKIPVVLEGIEATVYEERELHKKNPELGKKRVAFGPRIFLEEQDCVLLSEGEELTLMDWGNAIVKKIEKKEDGTIQSLILTLHLEGDFKTTKQKLSWIADTPANIPIELFEFDHLITERNIDKDQNIDNVVRERTEYKLEALAEEAVLAVKKGDIIQFQRRGFFICDSVEPVRKFFFIPDGHLKHCHLSAMARWGPPATTLEERKERDKKQKEKTEGKKEKKEGEAPPKVETKEEPKVETKVEVKEKEEPKEEKDTEGDEKGESKKAAKKREKEEAKRKQQEARDAEAAEKQRLILEKLRGKFGDQAMVQSQSYRSLKFTEVGELNPSLQGQSVLVRARISTIRATGKVGFCVLRHTPFSVQAVITESESVPREAITWFSKLHPESVVDVYGKLVLPQAPIVSTTQQDVEIQIERMFLVSASPTTLPFQLADAARKELTEEEIQEAQAAADRGEGKGVLTTHVALDNKLNSRWLDLRTKANHGIFHLQHSVGRFFREYLESQDFVEIHSPKIIATASEGGANVFKVDYFKRDAFLAQSPQLYKQMAIMSDLHRVYEIGPVFRAEKSFTHRHLTEFVGLDVEMAIKEHYYEVLDVAEELFQYIFVNLNTRCRQYIEMVREQYPFEDMTFKVPEEKIHELGMEILEGGGPEPRDPGKVRNLQMRSLRLSYPVGVEMVNAKLKELRPLTREQLWEQYRIKTKNEYEREQALADMSPVDDLSTQNEKLLGRVVKEKYGVDFFILDRYPSTVRPFYTMPSHDDSRYTNSYDMFIRGEEISSGAQRIHDSDLLLARAEDLKVDLTPIKDYVDSFRLGAYPHGGFGVGLERVVMLFLGMHEIRKTSMFPRDPQRTTP